MFAGGDGYAGMCRKRRLCVVEGEYMPLKANMRYRRWYMPSRQICVLWKRNMCRGRRMYPMEGEFVPWKADFCLRRRIGMGANKGGYGTFVHTSQQVYMALWCWKFRTNRDKYGGRWNMWANWALECLFTNFGVNMDDRPLLIWLLGNLVCFMRNMDVQCGWLWARNLNLEK